MKCARLDSIIERHGCTQPRFLAVDTEGNELRVFESIDWNNFQVDVIGYEVNGKDDKIRHLLIKNGIRRIGAIGADSYWIRTEFERKNKAKISEVLSKFGMQAERVAAPNKQSESAVKKN